ncbi:hypothetical protein CIP107577_02068 [Corynebacterium diphtheriae]|nr:hypothetical protein CIP107577_02068 [Corynebacterium diphtheriae]
MSGFPVVDEHFGGFFSVGFGVADKAYGSAFDPSGGVEPWDDGAILCGDVSTVVVDDVVGGVEGDVVDGFGAVANSAVGGLDGPVGVFAGAA